MMRTGIIQGRRLRERAGMRIRMLSVGQAAHELDVSPSTIRNWVEKGYLHAFRLPSGVRRIPQDEVSRLVNDYMKFAAPVDAADGPGDLTLEPEEEKPIWGPTLEEESLLTPRSSDPPLTASSPPDSSIAL